MKKFLMPVSDVTRAVLMLCAMPDAGLKPLTPAEFRGVREATEARGLPVSALCGDASLRLYAELRTRDTRKPVTAERLCRLLGRTDRLSELLDCWAALGIGVLSRDDAAYPKRWVPHLGNKAPDLLFYAGSPALFEAGGMAFVGSRALSETARQATARVAGVCAASGRTVISGGAKGADSAAMDAAFAAGGTVVGILPGRFAAEVKKQREALGSGRLLLCAAAEPSAGFSAARALGRNRLIYALADASFVAQSDLRSGGTWAGAYEELCHRHPHPVFVYAGGDFPPGCRALIDAGGIPWHDTDRFDAMWDRFVARFRPRQAELFEEETAFGLVAESDGSDGYDARS